MKTIPTHSSSASRRRTTKTANALFLLAAGAAGCDADDVDALEERAGEISKVAIPEQMLCDQRACLIHRAVDLDGDGVADIDELALGTDPDRLTSRPTLDELFRTLPELPTLRDGSSMLLVLPAFTPFGNEVFGGEVMLAARQSMLERMGIDLGDELVPDLKNGFTLTRSIDDANAVEFAVPPWLVPAVPGPDTTMDAGVAGAAMKGHGPASDFVIHSASMDDVFAYAQFSYRDEHDIVWNVTTQSSPGYSSATATAHEDDVFGGSYDQEIDVTQHSDGYGTETTTKSSLRWSNGAGQSGTSSKTVIDQQSVDHKQWYHHTEMERSDGTTISATTMCSEGACGEQPTGEQPTPPQPVDDGSEPDTAYVDPDYMEYSPSPEVMDAAIALHQGPVMTVNPLDADEQYLQFDATGMFGHDKGDIVFFANDGYSTTSDPIIAHMPPAGDPAEGPPEEGPAPDDGYKNGQCIYCNQGG